jgi:DinB superfamily
MLAYLKNVTVDCDEATWTKAVPGAVNPPAFVVGHLAMSLDLALNLLGQPGLCPPEWHSNFGPEADPAKVSIAYPSRSEYLAVMDRCVDAIAEAAKSQDAAAMAAPQSFKFFVNTPIKTVKDCVALLMTTHFSLHIGQLSMMRRVTGKPPLF